MPKIKEEMQGNKFEIRSYNPGDETAICALFERVFQKPMGKTESIRHWRWEFLNNPIKPVSIKLAWDGDCLVGQEAGNLLRIYSQGNEYFGLLIFDSMTDPSYQGLGIFTKTAKIFYKELSEQGYQFVFGFPNSNIVHSRTKNLSWRIIHPTPIYVRPLDLGHYVRNKTGNGLLGNCVGRISRSIFSLLGQSKGNKRDTLIEIRTESAFGQWADALWDICKDQHKLWVVRDYKYLSWRYDMRPESSYRLYTAWLEGNIAGYIIVNEIIREEGRVVFIADILADARVNDIVDYLLDAVIFDSKKNGAAMISSMLMPNSLYHAAFRKNYFFRLPQKLFPQKIYFGACSLNSGIPQKILYDANSWHISWGDTDLL